MKGLDSSEEVEARRTPSLDTAGILGGKTTASMAINHTLLQKWHMYLSLNTFS